MKLERRYWTYSVLFSTLIIICCIGGIVFLIDPCFHYHEPLSFCAYEYNDERYQNNGIIKNFVYDSLITGDSMAENFKVSEWDSFLGTKTVKIPFCGSYYKEQNDALKDAFRYNNNIRYVMRTCVYWLLHCDKDSSINEQELCPTYLSNDILIDDFSYVLNKDVLIYKVFPIITNTLQGKNGVDFNSTYFGSWRGVITQSPAGRPQGKQYVLDACFPRPEQSNEIFRLTDDEKKCVRESIRQNFVQIAKDHPETTFYVFFPPYSIMYYDMLSRQGRLEWHFELEQNAIEEMLSCDNIKLYSFSNNFDLVCDLTNYCDMGHYGPSVNSDIIKWMQEDKYLLTRDNYLDYMKTIRGFYYNFRYEDLWKGYIAKADPS